MTTTTSQKLRYSNSAREYPLLENIGAIYDDAGDAYSEYADGDPKQLFAFDGLHGYADKCVWTVLANTLHRRRASGATSLRVLDAGCGPGTWLRRVVAHALALGFESISARGFDVSEVQVRRARSLAHELAIRPGVSLTFEVADLEDPLPERDASVDLTLCLYSVLSHLPAASLAGVTSEFARVTVGHFVATVRPVGSTPTIFIDSLEKARRFQRCDGEDRCDIELHDGRCIAARFHLFEAAELRGLFDQRFHIEDLRGLDLFHGRFTPDRRWNPPFLADDDQVRDALARLEETFSTNPSFMERATHLLMVARRRIDVHKGLGTSAGPLRAERRVTPE